MGICSSRDLNIKKKNSKQINKKGKERGNTSFTHRNSLRSIEDIRVQLSNIPRYKDVVLSAQNNNKFHFTNEKQPRRSAIIDSLRKLRSQAQIKREERSFVLRRKIKKRFIQYIIIF